MKAVVFDLDGTLINSLKDIALCMNDVLKEFNYKTHEIEQYNYFVGDGALVLSQNVLPNDSTQEEVQMVFKRFKEVYDLNIYHNTKPYEGIMELLKKLENEEFKLGILSNKPHEFTLKYAQKYFKHLNIQEVHGQKEDIPKKPHPMGALNIAKNFNLDTKEIFYVGDTSTDMKTATNANMKSIGVAWGFRPVEELLEHKANFIANDPQELFEIIMRFKS